MGGLLEVASSISLFAANGRGSSRVARIPRIRRAFEKKVIEHFCDHHMTTTSSSISGACYHLHEGGGLPASASSELPALNVFLAYDVAETGRSAVATFDRIATHLKDELLFTAQVWRFDLLTNPECGKQAEDAVTAADILVVAFRAETQLPGRFLAWLSECVKARSEPGRALAVAPVGQAQNPAAMRAVRQLRFLAERKGLGFVCDESAFGFDDWKENTSPGPARLLPASPRTEETARRLVPLNQWGINE